ncbi:MAG: SDR family oxidoreductase [Bacteroidota bacterium]
MYAVITGASKGIGKAIAIELAKRHYNLVLVARSADLLNQVKKEIQTNHPVAIETLGLDLSSHDAASKLLAFCESKHLKVSVLVNNAGYGLSGKIDKYSLDDNSNMVQLNVLTLTQITQVFLPILEKNSPSYLLNVASTAAYQAIPNLAIYSATKAFVLSFSRALHHELKPRNISVTCVSPGGTNTDFSHRAEISEKALKAGEKVNMSPEDVAKIGVDALFTKKAEVVTGILNKIGAFGAWLMPKFISEKIAGSIYE